MKKAFERLAIPISCGGNSSAGWWILENSSRSISLSLDECVDSEALPKGWRGKPYSEDKLPPIELIEKSNQTIIRLLETRSYDWRIELMPKCGSVKIESSLTRSKNWKARLDHSSGEFKVVNHLGLSDFSVHVAEREELNLVFEFISTKFDFDTEYRKLTEDIAEFCQQMLLSWSAPTRLHFSSDPQEKSKLLLERFLFLRNFMNGDRLSRLLEAIGRNPHCQLAKERRWVPAGAARSTDYLLDPLRYLRDWRDDGNGMTPGEVCDVRKRETHDTAPNRFIKFALAEFRQLCADVCKVKWSEEGKPSSIGLEAQEMKEKLDALLARRFFNEVGRMQRIPLDNQTLQKREGYREVLQAWLLTQAATTLDWEGERDCYEGATRDVATLYEYWIFIQLHQILESIEGLKAREVEAENNPDRFIGEENGQLKINLKRGQRSRSCYEWHELGTRLKVDLYYERSFGGDKEATSSGSYSRRFRPDYTLTLYPKKYETEAAAEAEGKVAHLHFDAKYRAKEIPSVFGIMEVDEEALSREKDQNKAEQTYQQGDLLKMHTYNDALRQSIGSYVLYPGSEGDRLEPFRKFHEIAPGVGALAMKPGDVACLDTLRGFLQDVFRHQSDSFSQHSYFSESSYQTHKDSPQQVGEPGAVYNIARRDAPCVLLYVFKEHVEDFKAYGYAYCRVENLVSSKPLNIDLSIEIGSEFIPYGGALSEPKKTLGWRAKIRSARLVEKSEARKYIQRKYPTAKALPRKGDYYMLYEFDSISQFAEKEIGNLQKASGVDSRYMAITCRWADIIEKIPAETASTA